MDDFHRFLAKQISTDPVFYRFWMAHEYLKLTGRPAMDVPDFDDAEGLAEWMEAQAAMREEPVDLKQLGVNRDKAEVLADIMRGYDL